MGKYFQTGSPLTNLHIQQIYFVKVSQLLWKKKYVVSFRGCKF